MNRRNACRVIGGAILCGGVAGSTATAAAQSAADVTIELVEQFGRDAVRVTVVPPQVGPVIVTARLNADGRTTGRSVSRVSGGGRAVATLGLDPGADEQEVVVEIDDGQGDVERIVRDASDLDEGDDDSGGFFPPFDSFFGRLFDR